ncbi:MAG: M20 family metallopeptidase [Dehalococcoidales bacterium]|nr:MAG: M20 family metallopeptidase [Dehalococcoidales bacterium]
MNIDKMKNSIVKEVENQRESLKEINREIHSNPELGFHEEQAAELLTDYLRENGFIVEAGICRLQTAFKAVYGKGKPAIAILAEYDSLPEMGHACGHNIIASSAVGAGVAARQAVDEYGGSVLVIGTPAEELYGGKIILAERDAFINLDAVMMVHPGTTDTATTEALACHTLDVEFIGRSAHAAARPEEGINALEALLLSFSAINSLRQHIRSTARIHGVVINGGEAANIVPAYSSGNFIVRAADDKYLEELKERVLDCFRGAATATGAEMRYKWDDVHYSPMRNNLTLAGLFAENMKVLGRDTSLSEPERAFGSTDMGNVSQIVPGIHGIIDIADKNVLVHSPEFAEAAKSDRGIEGMMDAAKAMAMTVADILSDSNIQTAIKEEFYSSS